MTRHTPRYGVEIEFERTVTTDARDGGAGREIRPAVCPSRRDGTTQPGGGVV